MNSKGSRNPEEDLKAESRKRKAMEKSEDGSPKSDEENSAPDSYRDDFPQSEINKSDIEHPQSEIELLPTANSKLQTETMEVHHHPEVEKKGFKEYLLEGLMIFIAVMMGFFAESYREHIVEKNREKEYVKEMVSNLKYDIEVCNNNIAADIGVTAGLDSLRGELKLAINRKINSGKLYYYCLKYSGMNYIAYFNTSAYTELKSSGSLRLIDNDKLVTNISDYYDRCIGYVATNLPDPAAVLKINHEFFSLIYFDDLVKNFEKKDKRFNAAYNFSKILVMQPAPKLLDTKPEDLQKLYDETARYEMNLKDYMYYLGWVKNNATPLIEKIKKQYHIDNE